MFVLEYGNRKGCKMARKKFKAEQIVVMLREAEIQVAKGLDTPEVCRNLGISEQTYYRWRKEYDGLMMAPVSRYPGIHTFRQWT